MADPEQPSAQRLRLFRGGRAGRVRRRSSEPSGLADRLAALEQQVEAALGERTGGSAAADHVRAVFENALAAYAQARRDLPEGMPGAVSAALLALLYRYWWRVHVSGIDRVPVSGPALVVANRAPTLVPYEAFVITHALATAPPVGRRAVALVEGLLRPVPALTISAASLRRVLERGDVVVVCPEGPRALYRPFRDRYRVASFGRNPFARVALEVGAPIVPVAVIGAAETHPVVTRFDALGQALGLPTLPITPTFPWLGVAGLMPLPTKWTLHFGPALEIGSAPESPGRLRARVRERLQSIILDDLRRRRSIFFG